MDIFLIVLASLIVLSGWVLSFAGISGTWLILIAAIGFDVVFDWSWDSWIPSIVFLFLCIMVEVVEFVSGLLGAKVVGGSRSSQVGAFIGTFSGGLVGSFLIPIPIVGTIIGVLGGGFLGALLGELRHHHRLSQEGVKGSGVKDGLKVGGGVMVARIFAIVIKAALSTLMVAWFIWVVVTNVSG